MKGRRSKLLSLVLVVQLIFSIGLEVYAGDGDAAALDAEATITRTSTLQDEITKEVNARQEMVDTIISDLNLILTPAQLQHYAEPKHIYFVTDISDGNEVEEEEIRTGIHNMLNQTVLHHVYFVPFKAAEKVEKDGKWVWTNSLKPNDGNATTPLVYSENFEKEYWNKRTTYMSVVGYEDIGQLITGVLDSKYRGDNNSSIPYRDKEVIVYANKGATIDLPEGYEEARIHWITRDDVTDTKGQLATTHTGVKNKNELSKAFDETVQNIMQDTSKINLDKIKLDKMLYNETLPVGVELVGDKITLMSAEGVNEKEFANIRKTGTSEIGLTINHEFILESDSPITIKWEAVGKYRLQGKMKYQVKYNNTGEMNFLGGWVSPIAGANGARFFIDKYVVGVKGDYPTIQLKAYPKLDMSKSFVYKSGNPGEPIDPGDPENKYTEYQFTKVADSSKTFAVLEGNNRYVDFEVKGKDLNPGGLKTQIIPGPLDLAPEKMEAFEQKIKDGEWGDPDAAIGGGGATIIEQDPKGLWIQRYESNHIEGGVDMHNLNWKNKTKLFQNPIPTADDDLQGNPDERKGYVTGYEQNSKVSPEVAHKNAFFAPTDYDQKKGNVKEIRQMWGYFQLPKDQPTGEYYFAFFADDGVYAHIITPSSVEGKSQTNVLVDALRPSAPYLATVPNAKPLALEKGVKYPIYIEYYNIGDLGSLEMFMRSQDKGPWTFRNGAGNKIIENKDTINLSRVMDECFTYSQVTSIEAVEEGTLTGKVEIPDAPGIYYVAVKASTKGGAQIETVMGPFIRVDTTTKVNYIELCSVYPVRQLQLGLEIDVSNKAYVVGETDLGMEIIVPRTEYTFKLESENLSGSINSTELYKLKEAPKLYAIQRDSAKISIKDINTLGEGLKSMTIKKDGEDIIITVPQQSLLVGEGYKELLKADILITVNVGPHDKLRLDTYSALLKNNPTQISYVPSVKTEDLNTGVVTEEIDIEDKEIKVQLLDNKIN